MVVSDIDRVLLYKKRTPIRAVSIPDSYPDKALDRYGRFLDLRRHKALISQGFMLLGGLRWTPVDRVLAEQEGFEPSIR